MVACGGASVGYADTVADYGLGHELAEQVEQVVRLPTRTEAIHAQEMVFTV